MSLHHRFRRSVGLLPVDAPVAELLERYRHAGDRATHECSRPHYAKIAIEILDLGLAGHRRWTIGPVEHAKPPGQARIFVLGAGET
jgi:hypothetical protein